MADNIHWIEEAGRNRLVVGSQARILYADAESRILIADAFNRKSCQWRNQGAGCTWTRHHDVSGAIHRSGETSIYTMDKASQPIWLSRMLSVIHSGALPGFQSTTGWSRLGRGDKRGFRMLLDGSAEAARSWV
ncbi:MAG: hypothetical protein R2744_04575 [Bacteroidales bacterium]